ncbi:MAG: hypothetical protein HYX78_09480 [Armatimonadetes bacterium]|nr:hypothetical protein [Armatimonadota bacterium]
MITTVTLNPTLDKTIYVKSIVLGDTNRIDRTELDAGGEGVNTEVYRELIEIAQAVGTRAILDADGEPLKLGMPACPMMIKPNLDEAR